MRINNELGLLAHRCRVEDVEIPEWLIEDDFEPQVADFRELVSRLRGKQNVTLDVRDCSDLALLHEFRNTFVHSSPTGWVIHADSLRVATLAGLCAISEICDNAVPKRVVDLGEAKRISDHCRSLLSEQQT